MLRLFVTNPSLLKAVRPRTYDLICAAGLCVSERRHWHEVLSDAPARTREMAERRVG